MVFAFIISHHITSQYFGGRCSTEIIAVIHTSTAATNTTGYNNKSLRLRLFFFCCCCCFARKQNRWNESVWMLNKKLSVVLYSHADSLLQTELGKAPEIVCFGYNSYCCCCLLFIILDVLLCFFYSFLTSFPYKKIIILYKTAGADKINLKMKYVLCCVVDRLHMKNNRI